MGNATSTSKPNFYITKVSNLDLPLVPFVHTIISYNNTSLLDTNPLSLKEVLLKQDLILEVYDIIQGTKFKVTIPQYKGDSKSFADFKMGINIIKLNGIPQIHKLRVLAIKESANTMLKVGDQIIGIENDYSETENELIFEIKSNNSANLVVIRDNRVMSIKLEGGELGCEVASGIIYQPSKIEYFMSGYTGSIVKEVNKPSESANNVVSNADGEALKTTECAVYTAVTPTKIDSTVSLNQATNLSKSTKTEEVSVYVSTSGTDNNAGIPNDQIDESKLPKDTEVDQSMASNSLSEQAIENMVTNIAEKTVNNADNNTTTCTTQEIDVKNINLESEANVPTGQDTQTATYGASIESKQNDPFLHIKKPEVDIFNAQSEVTSENHTHKTFELSDFNSSSKELQADELDNNSNFSQPVNNSCLNEESIQTRSECKFAEDTDHLVPQTSSNKGISRESSEGQLNNESSVFSFEYYGNHMCKSDVDQGGEVIDTSKNSNNVHQGFYDNLNTNEAPNATNLESLDYNCVSTQSEFTKSSTQPQISNEINNSPKNHHENYIVNNKNELFTDSNSHSTLKDVSLTEMSPLVTKVNQLNLETAHSSMPINDVKQVSMIEPPVTPNFPSSRIKTASYVYRSPKNVKNTKGLPAKAATNFHNLATETSADTAQPKENSIPTSNNNIEEENRLEVVDDTFLPDKAESIMENKDFIDPNNRISDIFNEADISNEKEYLKGEHHSNTDTAVMTGSLLVSDADVIFKDNDARIKDESFNKMKSIKDLFEDDDDDSLPFEKKPNDVAEL